MELAGVTFAWFQSDGTLPVSNDLVNNKVRMSVHISIFSFNTLPAMVSGRKHDI
jgi:hypothetical protein